MSEDNANPDDEILHEYSLEGGVRGGYADPLATDHRHVLLDPDVAEIFPDSESVNRALRAFVKSQAGLGDYTKERDDLFRDLTLDEILAELRLKTVPEAASRERVGRSPDSHKWSVSDDAAALYVYKYGHTRVAASVAEAAERLGIKVGSFRMRVGNFKALGGGGGLGNFARQSREVYERYGNLPEPEFRAVAFPRWTAAKGQGSA